MNKFRWAFEEARWFLIRCYHVIFKKYILDDSKYGRYKLINSNEGNEEISKRIESGEPFAFCRFSFVEMDLMIRCRTEEFWRIKTYKKKEDIMKMYQIKGEKKTYGIRKFSELMRDSIETADILGVWRNIPMGDAYIDSLDNMEGKVFADACAVEPYVFPEPWSAKLKGKRVLVVSPFSKEVKYQYSRREHIWGNKEILPDFSLDTVDSVWYFLGCKDDRFSNWFEALDYLYCEIMKKDFDVVLLGCGFFGFPLAAQIKKAGKQAIHMGGAVQILFGIKGKRWDNTQIGDYYNEYWIRPGEESKPKDSDKLDGACYW